MASIFKRGDQSQKRRSPYYVEYTDHHGKRQTVKGFTDKGLTEQLAAKLETETLLRKRGIIDPTLEHFAEQKKAPLEDHLKSFEQAMAKTTPKHVSLTMSRVRRVVAGCKFASLGQITLEKVENYLRQLMTDDDLGHRTYNHYVQAFDAFCNWLVQTKRIIANPIVGLERLNNEVDVRHKRRALTVAEVNKLLESARKSAEKIQNYTGEQRARIYLFSYFTGLRRSEMASLTPSSFQLDSDQPTLTIEAACSKHRRKDVLPLHPDLVVIVKSWIKGMEKDEPLFPKLDRRKTWLMVKKDLERAGIEYETAEGIADFHAAGRHTYVTGLLRNGVSITEARELARHSDVRMTMKYTHIGLEDQAKALAELPSPPESLQYIYSTSDGVAGHKPSLPVIACRDETQSQETLNPCEGRGYDVACQSVSADGKTANGWRRRELNPRPFATQVVLRQAVAKISQPHALHWRCSTATLIVSTWLQLTLNCTK